MRIGGPWLTDTDTQALCQALESAGHRALFVGGCVRDAILNRKVGDIDLATDATPDRATEIAQTAGFKVIPTGIDHGTVTVVTGGCAHEVTTFRRDIRTDGRHAVVEYSNSVEEDAKRRDFTMNALYADRHGHVIDPLGGLPDVLAGRVRFIGDPVARIKEDYLRILRFFRFQAWYGDSSNGPQADDLAACAAESAGLETLSRERVGAEMRKLLSAPDPLPAIGTMAMAGVLATVLPGADPRALGPFLHHAAELAILPDAIARLAAIDPGDADDRLRLTKAESRRLRNLRDASTGTMSAGELGYRLGLIDGLTALCLRAALFEQPLGNVASVVAGAKAICPIKAVDLPDFEGAALGARLRALEAKWIDSGFVLSKADLLG